MLVNGKHYKTVWMKKDVVKMIDQTLLPHEFKVISLKDYNETADSIRNMLVRGAGAIGATGGYGLAQAALQAPDTGFLEYMRQAKETLWRTRPTAQNLFYALERVWKAIERNSNNPKKAREESVKEAEGIAREDEEACRKIGEHGAALIKTGMKIETHCNAGWLAFVDWGSALSPIYRAVRHGKQVFVYVDETRPRGQGSKLTSWELQQERIPHAIIPDTAPGSLMRKGEVDLIITGADRIAINGDTANKIGTYQLAVLAKENNVPFYIAAPTTTIDPKTQSGEEIPIEERSEEEVLLVSDGSARVRIAPEGAKARNPAFDVTPAKYIRGFITERGILKPEELKGLFS